MNDYICCNVCYSLNDYVLDFVWVPYSWSIIFSDICISINMCDVLLILLLNFSFSYYLFEKPLFAIDVVLPNFFNSGIICVLVLIFNPLFFNFFPDKFRTGFIINKTISVVSTCKLPIHAYKFGLKTKCLKKPFLKWTSWWNWKAAINWKPMKITFVKKVMILLIARSI